MKTTNEVIDAVVAGTAVTEEELRYAVRNLSVWQNSLVFDLARALTEEPMTAKTKRGLQRAWDSMKQGNAIALDKRLKGTSYEPGISKEESRDRFASATASGAMKLMDLLTKGKQQ